MLKVKASAHFPTIPIKMDYIPLEGLCVWMVRVASADKRKQNHQWLFKVVLAVSLMFIYCLMKYY